MYEMSVTCKSSLIIYTNSSLNFTILGTPGFDQAVDMLQKSKRRRMNTIEQLQNIELKVNLR